MAGQILTNGLPHKIVVGGDVMKFKNRSRKSLLLDFYRERMPFFYKSGILLIFIAELFVMYVIQNNFGSCRLQSLGLILLAISLILSGIVLSAALKRVKDNDK